MYEKIVDENPRETPMMIYPAIHYTMGGLWVDYELMTTVQGLFSIGESNFSDHGANRLGASALMQGLADGYFILPYTIQNYLSTDINKSPPPADSSEFINAEKNVKDRLKKLISIDGHATVDSFHRRLGKVMWDNAGMARNEAGLSKAIADIKELREEFWKEIKIPGDMETINNELEKASRVADFLELGELIARDALHRKESCGGHFREEYQTDDGETMRNDKEFSYVAAWEYKGEGNDPFLHREALNFELARPEQRSYK